MQLTASTLYVLLVSPPNPQNRLRTNLPGNERILPQPGPISLQVLTQLKPVIPQQSSSSNIELHVSHVHTSTDVCSSCKDRVGELYALFELVLGDSGTAEEAGMVELLGVEAEDGGVVEGLGGCDFDGCLERRG